MLQNNTFNKIISVVIAMVLWAYVMVEVNPTTTKKIDIPVQILNEENLTQRGLAIVGEREFSVTVTLEGKRSVLDSLDKSALAARADVYGRTMGEGVSISVEVDVPDTVKDVTNKIPRIIITIEELIAVQKPIEVEFEGQFRANTEPGNITVQPGNIEVTGARSFVEEVSHIVAKVDSSQITADKKLFNVEAVPVNSNGEFVEEVSLSSSTVDVEVSLCYTKEIPMYVEIIGEVGADYEVTGIKVPESVTIKGLKEALAAMDGVTAGAIDISRVTASTNLPITFTFPEGVELAEVSRDISVEVGIKGISTGEVTVPGSQIQIRGLAPNQTAYISTDAFTIKVVGNEELIKNMTAGDFVLSVDVQGLETGTHLVKVTAEAEKNFTDIDVTPQEVNVTINEVS